MGWGRMEATSAAAAAATRSMAMVVGLGLVAALAAGIATAGCSNGTTPVCDDAGW